MASLSGKTFLLTGASRGFGKAIASQLWRAGASLALTARDGKALESVAGGLADPAAGQFAAIFPCDLADCTAVEEMYGTVRRRLGDVDGLINNAAIQGPLGPVETLDFTAWRGVFEIDLFAAVRLCQLVIPGMRRRGGGKIVSISGGGATGPRPDVSAYAAAKTAIVRFSETIAEELKEAKIDVNCVSPGAMNTDMLEQTLAAGPEGIRREYAAALERKQKGGVQPEKAAELVVFLCSPQSNGITGRLIASIWDDWKNLPTHLDALSRSDVYTLRRIVGKDRGMEW